MDLVFEKNPVPERIIILGVVLARGGSKGIPGKNKAKIAGKPLINWTLEEAVKSKYLTDIVVSSDDGEILQLARDCGTIALWRPDYLAQDTTPTLPALQHAVSTFENLVNYRCDYVVELRATSPLKTVEDIDGAIELLTNSGVSSVIGVVQCQEYHPGRVKYLDEHGYIHDFGYEAESLRRQDLSPKAYVRNGTIYAYPRDVIMGKEAKLVGHATSTGFVMPPDRSVNIDDELDFILAEALLERKLKGV